MLYQRPVQDEKLREVISIVLIISLMLSRIFSEALMSISNKHNYKIFTKRRPASLLHCIESILNHSSGKCRDSLTMAALTFTNNIFSLISPQQQRNYRLEKKMLPIPLLVFVLYTLFIQQMASFT